MSVAPVLKNVTNRLRQNGIAYMLVGSYASSFHGALRATHDVDVVIDATPEQLPGLIAGFHADNYYAELDAALDALRHQSMFNVIDSTTGWKIDLIFRKSRAFDLGAFNRRLPVKLFDIQLFVATAEDVIISKLEWAKLSESHRQIEDVARLMEKQWNDLDRDYLSKWISALELQQQWAEAKRSADILE